MWPCCPFYSWTFLLQKRWNSSEDCYIPVLYCAGPGVFTYVSQNPITACGTCRPPTFCTENRATPPGWWLLRKHQSERQGVLTCDLPVNGCITTLLPCSMPPSMPTASSPSTVNCNSLPAPSQKVKSPGLQLFPDGTHLCIEPPRARVTLERLQRMLQGVLGGLEPNFMQAGCHTWCHRQGGAALRQAGAAWQHCCCCCGRTQLLNAMPALTEKKERKDLAKKSECRSAGLNQHVLNGAATWQRSEGR